MAIQLTELLRITPFGSMPGSIVRAGWLRLGVCSIDSHIIQTFRKDTPEYSGRAIQEIAKRTGVEEPRLRSVWKDRRYQRKGSTVKKSQVYIWPALGRA